MSIEKLGSSVYDSNSSNIVDSTRPGFVSTYQKGKKGVDAPETPTDTSRDRITEKFVKDTVEKTLKEKTTPQDEKAAADLMKNLMKKNLQNLKASDFTPGKLVFFKYPNPVTAETAVWDITPMSLILDKSKSKTLGINFHWLSPPLRKILVKLIFKANAKNIRENKPLEFNYRKMKPLLKQLGLLNIVTTKIANGKRVSNSCVRLYINSRISKRGLVIPPEYWLIAVGLEASSFSDNYNPSSMYKKATNYYKSNRTKLYRNRKK